MNDGSLSDSAAPAAIPPLSHEARALLPPGSSIPPRYERIATCLQTWQMPDYLVQMGLLLRHIERGRIAPHQLGPVLGTAAAAGAAALVALNGNVPRPSLQRQQTVWRLFTLTYLHPEASLLKITELLVQLRYTPDADINLSSEMLHAAAHVCANLGMWQVRAELLDGQARLADPLLVRRVAALLEQSQPKRTRFFAALAHELTTLLHAHNLSARIERRPHALHRAVEVGVESLQGTFPHTDAIVLLIDDVQDCYRALGIINRSYPVVAARVRDFIGGPKDNGYQAIHTTIEYTVPPHHERTMMVDIRLTTPALDHFNRNGYLAYLAGMSLPSRRSLWWTNRQRWLAAYHEQSAELFVYTPHGETIFLPRSATVLDFAVRIHSKLGVYCRGATINGHQAAPNDRLECGDICEVLIDPSSEPISYRLLDQVSTATARGRIRRALQKDQTGAARGRTIFREVLLRALETQEVHASKEQIDQQVAQICRERNYQTVEAFYRAVARGEAAPDATVRTIIGNLLIPRLDLDTVPAAVRQSARRVRLALCCQPRPSRPAVAVAIHKGHELKIHTASCSHVSEPAYALTWHPAEDRAYVADVLYESWDRPGLIHQVTGTLAAIDNLNILSFSASVPEPSLARLCFSFEASSQAKIAQVRTALEHLPEQRNVDVRTVRLIDHTRIAQPLANPYGPQPEGRWPFFVGRSDEVRQIIAHLSGQHGTNHVLIRGPKRIGKSSLLQHLSRYHLQDFEVPGLLDLQSLPTADLRLPGLLQRIAEMILQKAGTRVRNIALELPDLERHPIEAFGTFLHTLRQPSDLDRFVIPIDEFGVVMSRLRDSPQATEFFDQWRALLSNPTVAQHVAFVVVLPDQTPPHIAPTAFDQAALRIGELGYPVRLNALSSTNARDLMTTPIRPHLAYQQADIEYLLHETGGHPYYIQLVCGAIIAKIQIQQRKTGLHLHERQEIPTDVVRQALSEAIYHDDAFYHVLADSTPTTQRVLRAIAGLTDETNRWVHPTQLQDYLAPSDDSSLQSSVEQALYERPDLLVAHNNTVGLRAALVARWLQRLRHP